MLVGWAHVERVEISQGASRWQDDPGGRGAWVTLGWMQHLGHQHLCGHFSLSATGFSATIYAILGLGSISGSGRS